MTTNHTVDVTIVRSPWDGQRGSGAISECWSVSVRTRHLSDRRKVYICHHQHVGHYFGSVEVCSQAGFLLAVPVYQVLATQPLQERPPKNRRQRPQRKPKQRRLTVGHVHLPRSKRTAKQFAMGRPKTRPSICMRKTKLCRLLKGQSRSYL